MSTVSKAMLKECLMESILSEIREIEALDYSHIVASYSFKEQIKNTIANTNIKKKHTPKKLILIFIAAILVSLSVMFAVSAEMRQKTIDFFVQVYDTFAEFIIVVEEEPSVDSSGSSTSSSTADSEKPEVTYPTKIETVYKLSYIDKNNYFELDKIESDLQRLIVWTNGEAIIDLTQCIVDSTASLDTENASHQIAYIASRKVYYTAKNGIYTVSWLEHGYVFTMTCDEFLGWEEVEKIVSSLEPIAN